MTWLRKLFGERNVEPAGPASAEPVEPPDAGDEPTVDPDASGEWSPFIQDSSPGASSIDANALVQEVLKESYSDTQEDLKYFGDKVKDGEGDDDLQAARESHPEEPPETAFPKIEPTDDILGQKVADDDTDDAALGLRMKGDGGGGGKEPGPVKTEAGLGLANDDDDPDAAHSHYEVVKIPPGPAPIASEDEPFDVHVERSQFKEADIHGITDGTSHDADIAGLGGDEDELPAIQMPEDDESTTLMHLDIASHMELLDTEPDFDHADLDLDVDLDHHVDG